jgi:hypothetical protein
MHLVGVGMSYTKAEQGTTVFARVRVRDVTGSPVANATITGTWSGAATGPATLLTSSNGHALTSTPVLTGTGEAVFTVTSVNADKRSYQEGLNLETMDSIAF